MLPSVSSNQAAFSERLQRSDGVTDVVDLEAQRRMFGLRSFVLRKQRDLGAAAAVDELAVGPQSVWLEAKSLLVKAPSAG